MTEVALPVLYMREAALDGIQPTQGWMKASLQDCKSWRYSGRATLVRLVHSLRQQHAMQHILQQCHRELVGSLQPLRNREATASPCHTCKEAWSLT